MKLNVFRSNQPAACCQPEKSKLHRIAEQFSQWCAVTDQWLLNFYKTCERVDAGVDMGTIENFTLSGGKTLSVEEHTQVERIQVQRGKVWLTATPGDRDIVLQAGDEFRFSANWPVVIEALDEAEVTLVPKGRAF